MATTALPAVPATAPGAGFRPGGPERCLVLWFPGWPVTSWALATGESAAEPVGVVSANRVTACSPAAVAEGVVIGQRRREAQSRCPSLRLVPADEARDAREFEPVVECVEQVAPGVQLIRPGLCALRARGPSGYLGGEAVVGETLLEAVVAQLGITTGRVGVADGLFAATQAARAGDPVKVVAPGESARFLAGLPVARLGEPALAGLLPRLGIHTLGEFAALGEAAVRDRFGVQGARWHALAAGADAQVVHPRVPPPELSRALDFEPPLDRVEQVAFTARTTAESFIHALTAAGLTCTELRVELSGELDELVARSWLLPGGFDASAVIDRVRWQLQAAAGGPLRSRVTGLRLEPVMLDDVANQTPGLFGSGPDERVHHVLSRVQAMLGYEGVVTPRLCGGRWLAERQELVPWGERPAVASALERPWPGLVPDPLPALVFAEPLPVRLLAADGAPVAVDGRGRLGGGPEVVEVLGDTYRVTQWAGPWPIDERPWDPQRHRVASRFQVVDETGGAWLLFLDGRGWWAEARYD